MSTAKQDFFLERGFTRLGRVQHAYARWFGTVFSRGLTVVVLTDDLRATHYENVRETLPTFYENHGLVEIE